MVNAESVVQTLDAMERKFRGGFGWGRGMRRNWLTGKMCLMGAVEFRACNGRQNLLGSGGSDRRCHCLHGAGGARTWL